MLKLRSPHRLAATLAAALLTTACTFEVNTTDDSVDIAPGDNQCKDARGLCSLRAAVMEANANANGDRIEVPTGVYKLTLPASSGGGSLTITNNVTIRGAGAASTIIDGNLVTYSGQPGGCPESGTERTVFRINNGNVTLSYLTIQGGYAQNGGGVYVVKGTTEITDSVIRSNAAYTGGGGLLVDKGIVRVRRTAITQNCAVGAFGGGIRNSAGEVWMYESLVSNNRSNRAGGIRNDGLLNLRSTTVSGNGVESPDAGTGGISQGGFAFLNNVTLTNNSGRGNQTASFTGGGIQTLNTGTTVVKNSIIAKNNGLGGADDCAGKAFTADSRFNLIGNTTGCALPANTSTWLLNINPNLGALASNGGPTQTHALLSGSPAVNMAYQFPPPAADGCEPHDQRGVPHPQGGRCDMGAYESGNAFPFVTRFVLVDADTDADIMPLRNGELLNLAELPPNLNIRVELTGSAGSVIFSLDGAPKYKVENNAPFALGGDNPAGDYLPTPLPAGEHVLRATPFSGPDGVGASGGSLEVRFVVGNG